MGNTFKTGNYVNAIFQDSSNNIGIGAANSSFKFQVTGTTNLTGALSGTSATFKVNADRNLAIKYDTNITLSAQSDTGGPESLRIYADTFRLYTATSTVGLTERFTITNGGNVGIGTDSPTALGTYYTTLQLKGKSGGTGNEGGYLLTTDADGTTTGQFGTDGNFVYFGSRSNTDAVVTTNNTERMRITSGGYLKASNNGSYGSTTSPTNEFNNNAADWIIVNRNTHGSSPYGIYMEYVNSSPNNTGNEFLYLRDSGAIRFRLTSNGNCYNVTGTYTSGVSDIRYKEQVVDANSQWEDIKNLRVVNFKFKNDVAENGENALRQIGFIAQEVEKTSPHLIDEMSDEKTGETWKTIKTSIIHTKAIKALQESMQRIENLESQIEELKALINNK